LKIQAKLLCYALVGHGISISCYMCFFFKFGYKILKHDKCFWLMGKDCVPNNVFFKVSMEVKLFLVKSVICVFDVGFILAFPKPAT
jgi:hypothetical protein